MVRDPDQSFDLLVRLFGVVVICIVVPSTFQFLYDKAHLPYFGTFVLFTAALGTIVYKGKLITFTHVGDAKTFDPEVALPGETQRANKASIKELAEADPFFSIADIEARVKNHMLLYEDSLCRGTAEPLRSILCEPLFYSVEHMIECAHQDGIITATEGLSVNRSVLESWCCEGGFEHLYVWLEVKKRTYTYKINDPTYTLTGDRLESYLFEYRWELIRPAGRVTIHKGLRVMDCPSCGAQTNLNKSGHCSFCGSIMPHRRNDWVLNKTQLLAMRRDRSADSDDSL